MGLKITTRYPIIANGKVIGNNVYLDTQFSGFVSTDKEDVKKFQGWVNSNKGGALTVDGIYGPKTEAAYNAYGLEYNTMNPPSSGGTGSSTLPMAEKKAATDAILKDKKLTFWQKLAKLKDKGIVTKAVDLAAKLKDLKQPVPSQKELDNPPVATAGMPGGNDSKDSAPMGTGMKILIGFGILAVLGGIFYAATHKKK